MIGTPIKTKKKAEAARLKAQADAILDRDATLPRDLGVHADALRRCYEELMLPRNDRDYVKALEDEAAGRKRIGNALLLVRMIVERKRFHYRVSPADDRDHAKGMEILREIMAHFENQGIREEDPYDATRSADYTQVREPKHAFGREKRSKPR
jgi:hypothetical protein